MCGSTVIEVPAWAVPAETCQRLRAAGVEDDREWLLRHAFELSLAVVIDQQLRRGDETCTANWSASALRTISAILRAEQRKRPAGAWQPGSAWPVAALALLMPKELSVRSWLVPKPPSLPMSTPKVKPLEVSSVTMVHSICTCGRRSSSRLIRSA